MWQQVLKLVLSVYKTHTYVCMYFTQPIHSNLFTVYFLHCLESSYPMPTLDCYLLRLFAARTCQLGGANYVAIVALATRFSFCNWPFAPIKVHSNAYFDTFCAYIFFLQFFFNLLRSGNKQGNVWL